MSAPRHHHSFHMGAAVLFVVAAITLVAAPFLHSVRSSTNSGPVVATKQQPQVKRKTLQPDLPGTLAGATDPASIPDTIAFELFMRSIADYPSEAAIKDFDLNSDQATNVLSYVQSFEDVLSKMDRSARTLRSSGKNPNALAKLQKQKEDFLSNSMNVDLPFLLGANGGSRLRAHLRNQVKPKTKRTPFRLICFGLIANAYCSSGRKVGF